MIACTGSAAEMCERERSRKPRTHSDASVCKLILSVRGSRECYLALSCTLVSRYQCQTSITMAAATDAAVLPN